MTPDPNDRTPDVTPLHVLAVTLLAVLAVGLIAAVLCGLTR